MNMRRIALVTYKEQPALNESDRLLVEPLARRGFSVAAIPWDQEDTAWSSFCAVVLRSCWDYHKKPDAFRQWVHMLDAQGVALWNPPASILWNMDKAYLRLLAVEGVPAISTLWPDSGDGESLAALLRRQGWDRAVIKPRIGANGHDILVVSEREAHLYEERYQALLRSPGVLVQQFRPEISQGEWSFIFVHQRFSHAVLKQPRPGNIFVQRAHGGSWSIRAPAQQLIDQAAHVLRQVQRLIPPHPPLLYARVDGLNLDGTFVLMELELIEPNLFFSADVPLLAEQLADALAQLLR